MDELVLEDDGECPVIKSSRLSAALNQPVSPDWVLMLGFIVCAAGWLTHLFWLTFGGFLFFFLGIQAIRNEKGGRCQGEGEGPKTP